MVSETIFFTLGFLHELALSARFVLVSQYYLKN